LKEIYPLSQIANTNRPDQSAFQILKRGKRKKKGRDKKKGVEFSGPSIGEGWGRDDLPSPFL